MGEIPFENIYTTYISKFCEIKCRGVRLKHSYKNRTRLVVKQKVL